MRVIKIAGVISLLICLCGLGIYGIGYACGGRQFVQKTDLLVEEKDTDMALYQLNEERLQNIHTIKVELKHIDFNLKPSKDSHYYLSYKLYGKKNPLSYQEKDGVLYLEEENGQAASYYVHVNVNFLDNMLGKKDIHDYENQVTLYIPSHVVLEDSVIKMGDGDLEINSFQGKNATLQLEDGDLEIYKTFLEDSAVSAEDGDIYISQLQTEGQLNFKTRDGDITASNLQISGRTAMETKDGDIDLKLSETPEQTSIAITTEDGDLSVKKSYGGNKQRKGDGWSYQRKGNQENSELKITAGDGDVTLK